MAQTVSAPDMLYTGMRMEREEFMRRWEALSDLKNAELIEGTVFVSSPVGPKHGRYDAFMNAWLVNYAAYASGLEVLVNTTCYLLNSAPQPDAQLRSRLTDDQEYPTTPPELIVEICESNYAYDLGPKRALYQRAGVKEYITLETFSRQLTWRSLEDGSYVDIQPGADGILRSRLFAGLWLHPDHAWTLDAPAMLRLLEHARQNSL